MLKPDLDYMIKIRRELHMYPEIDFDLPRTVALIKRELTDMGIPHTDKYGKGSVVGYINPSNSNFTIGVRADIDALKITEQTGVEYTSRNEGLMHACGHDAHAAVLLGTAKMLKTIENQLGCRVKLVFQPSEEGIKSGAAMMIENGVLNDVDIMLALHVEGKIPCGKLGVCPGYAQASSRHFKVEIEGKSAHAASPHTGIDALAIAFRMYSAIQLIVSREIDPKDQYLCSIGKLDAGTTQNVVADHALMLGTIRAYKDEVSKYIFDRICKIGDSLSNETGAKITAVGPVKSKCVYNNPALSEIVLTSLVNVVGEDNIVPVLPRMGSEDFSHFGTNVPAVLFRLGTQNIDKGIDSVVHNSDFNIDEDSLAFGASAFAQFVIDNQNGLDMEKLYNSDERENIKFIHR